MKKSATLYILSQKKIYYEFSGSDGQKNGEIDENKIEDFLQKNRPGTLNIVFGKPYVLFRSIELPFNNIKRIRLILPQELEEAMPEELDSYGYHFFFNTANAGKTVVNVFAVSSHLLEKWRVISKKFKAKLFFYSDTVLLHSLLNEHSQCDDYIGVYGHENYLLFNIVEAGVLKGSYSYHIKEGEPAGISGIASTIFSHKNIPVYFLGTKDAEELLLDVDNKINIIEGFENINKYYFFHFLTGIKHYKNKSCIFDKLKSVKEVNLAPFVAVFAVLVFSFIFFTPRFKVPEREKKLDDINSEMHKIFREAYPEVVRIVDPMVQMKEKLREVDSQINLISEYPSVLDVMAQVVRAFPEDIRAEIEHFNMAGGNLTISGTVESLKALDEIKKNIEGSYLFRTARIGTVTFDDRDMVRFNMTIGI